MKILLVDPHGTFKSPRLPRGIEIVRVSSDEVEKKLEDGNYNIIIVSEELYDAIGKIKKKPTVIVVPRFKEDEAFQNLLRSVELFGERVLEDESRFRDLFINVPVGLYRTTLDGKIIDANPELLRILGFERVEEVLKKKVEEFYLNPLDRKEFLRKLLKEGTVENHISRLVREGGEITWVEESARIVKGADGDFIEGAIKDITERMEAFQALKDSEERFRLFVENAHDGILIIDKPGRIIYANRKAAESLGVSREELIGKEFSEFLEEGERRIVERHFEERVKGKSVVSSYIVSAKTPKGEIRKLEVRPNVIRDSKGRIRVFVHFLDVTERLMAMKALRESEERFRTLFESASDAIFVMEGEVFAQCNETTLKMFGCEDKEEILGRNPWEFSPPKQPDGRDSLQKAREYINAALSGVPQRFYWKHMKKNGEPFDAEVSLNRFTVGGKTYILAVVRDVTEMVKVLQELKRYREELEEMVEERTRKLEEEKKRLAVTLFSIGEGVIVTDSEGRVTMMNRAAERLTGWKSDEAQGHIVEEVFTIVDGRSGNIMKNPVREALESKRVVTIQDDTVLVSKEGRKREIEDSASPIRSPNGELWGAVLVFRDVTDRKRMEEEMIRSQRLKSLSFLAGGLAHDFNNILTGILAYATIAKARAKDDVRLKEALESLEREAYRARSLTEQLLTFTRGGEPLKRVVNIVELVKESTIFFLSGSMVRCVCDFPDDFPAVEADPGQIRQVVSNIVQNSKEAMGEGGTIVVKGEVANLGKENPFALPPGKYVKITFKDEGPGIPPEVLPHIFDPFFSTKAEGRGLGLATCYYIVKNHGGHIEVESEVGRGTTVTVYLPATEKEAEEEEEEKSVEVKTGRVLLVDDQEAILETVGELLRMNGYEVEVAREGGEAVNKYVQALKEGRRFDAIIIDLTIPGGMGGKEALRKLKMVDKNVKAIVSTGYSNDPVVAHYREYGFSGVLKKPYRMQELLKTLSEVISRGY